MFIAPQGDHFRVRLTHTLDVSQIARTVARALRLNEDLTEAIALGHDLGHTPFGHLGEQALTPFLGRPFRHSEQSLRVVEHLENDGEGLNLTWEVRDGILHHPWSMPAPSTLEAQVVRFADRIAYINHDIDDADAGGGARAPKSCRPPRSRSSGRRHRDRIDRLVTDLVETSEDQPRGRASPSRSSARSTSCATSCSPRSTCARAPRTSTRRRCGCSASCSATTSSTPTGCRPSTIDAPGDLPTHVADFIAGMTDRYAQRTYESALPSPGLAPGVAPGSSVARIRQADIEAVKERTDIVQLVGQYLTLKRSGHDSLSGICPFHQEKTASFSVSPSKGVFYCFGCGKGGDAITFLRELETLSYVEAIERLAATAGVQLHYEGDSPAERRAAERRKALYRANEVAAGLYRELLADGPRGQRRRAPTPPSAGSPPRRSRRSRSATRPTYPDFLLRRLSGRRDLSSDLLLEAGLATRGDDGTVRDRFRGRLTFPIHDLQGRHIGFGARILPDDPRAGEQAKYLNTAETPIYRKQEILYNLHRARSAIARSGEAFVVEGYTDVIGLSQAGIANAVATCGTALGEKHFELLSRFAQRAVLVVRLRRGRRAGRRARVRVPGAVPGPGGRDDHARRARPGRVRGEARRRRRPRRPRPAPGRWWSTWSGASIGRHDLTSIEGQSAAVAEALPLLDRLQDPVRRSEYAGLRGRPGRRQRGLGAPVAPAAPVGQARRRSPGRSGGGPPPSAPSARWLRLLARGADTQEGDGTTLTEDHFRNATNRRLFVALRDAGGDVAALAGGEDREARRPGRGARGRAARGRPDPRVRDAPWRAGSTSSS